jgi:excisionase family DNA binding protein
MQSRQLDASDLESAVEIGKRLRLNSQSVRRMAKRGEIPCYKIGGRVMRFSWREVCEALAVPAPSACAASRHNAKR